MTSGKFILVPLAGLLAACDAELEAVTPSPPVEVTAEATGRYCGMLLVDHHMGRAQNWSQPEPVADGFSMAVSNYQVKSEGDARDRLRRQEERHIEQFPEGQRDEIRAIFEAKGFEGEALERIVETITQDRQRWIDVMIQEEYGVALHGPSPAIAGLATFSVFLLVGALPLLPLLVPVLSGGGYFVASGLVTLVALFGIGYAKGIVLGMARWTGNHADGRRRRRHRLPVRLFPGAAAGRARDKLTKQRVAGGWRWVTAFSLTHPTGNLVQEV